MKSAIVKRSVILNGHKTSISLENEFWQCLRDIADRKNLKLSVLLKQIDNNREHNNFSSAVRVYVLNAMCEQAAGDTTVVSGQRAPMPMIAELVAAD